MNVTVFEIINDNIAIILISIAIADALIFGAAFGWPIKLLFGTIACYIIIEDAKPNN